MDIDIQKSFAESYTFFDDYKRGGYSISNIIKSQHKLVERLVTISNDINICQFQYL